jgi:hypothetical protein
LPSSRCVSHSAKITSNGVERRALGDRRDEGHRARYPYRERTNARNNRRFSWCFLRSESELPKGCQQVLPNVKRVPHARLGMTSAQHACQG